jgi:tetratricopeptide (TPR) repeat protein
MTRLAFDFSSIEAESSLLDWRTLHTAHAMIRQANVDDAMQKYQRVLRNARIHFTPNGSATHWLTLRDEQDEPSLNWACVLLSEYYINARVWQPWREMAQQVFADPGYETLSDHAKSRLLSTWAVSRTRHEDWRPIEQQQLQALRTFELTPFEQALHHIALGSLYQVAMKTSESLEHLQQAASLISPDAEPYYAIRVQMFLAHTYGRMDQRAKGVEILDGIHDFVRQLGDNAGQENQYYGRGWLLMDMDKVEAASESFHHGLSNAYKHEMYYHIGLNQYGIGVASNRLGRKEEAVAYLHEALASFRRTDHMVLTMNTRVREPISRLMTALCLNNLAVLEEELGHRTEAADRMQEALYWFAGSKDIDQALALALDASRIFRKSGRWRQALHYSTTALILKTRLRWKKLL